MSLLPIGTKMPFLFIDKCKKCKKEREFSLKFDALYCPYCDRWDEPKCGDKTCEFCSKRPKKPSMCHEKPKKSKRKLRNHSRSNN